jgi:hypothetical protein
MFPDEGTSDGSSAGVQMAVAALAAVGRRGRHDTRWRDRGNHRRRASRQNHGEVRVCVSRIDRHFARRELLQHGVVVADPVPDRPKPRWQEGIDTVAACSPLPNKPGCAQDAQMLRERRAAHAERGEKIRDGAIALPQQIEDPTASGMRYRAERTFVGQRTTHKICFR